MFGRLINTKNVEVIRVPEDIPDKLEIVLDSLDIRELHPVAFAKIGSTLFVDMLVHLYGAQDAHHEHAAQFALDHVTTNYILELAKGTAEHHVASAPRCTPKNWN